MEPTFRSRNSPGHILQRQGGKRPRYVRFGNRLTSDWGRLAAFASFILLVAFLGGSSRPDIPGLVVLRPLAVLFCLYGLLVATAEQLRSARAALLLVGSLMLLALIQLVPLPWGLWGSLPVRELMAETSALAGS